MGSLNTKSKVRNSIGVYDIYKMMRKKKWYDIGRSVKEEEYYKIIRGVNKYLADEIALGNEVIFPEKMGKLRLRKFWAGPYLKKNGKVKVNYPIDWKSTKLLWLKDEEARKDKIVVRFENDYIYKVQYNKYFATYENKSFYKFDLNRFIAIALKENIINGKTDTLW